MRKKRGRPDPLQALVHDDVGDFPGSRQLQDGSRPSDVSNMGRGYVDRELTDPAFLKPPVHADSTRDPHAPCQQRITSDRLPAGPMDWRESLNHRAVIRYRRDSTILVYLSGSAPPSGLTARQERSCWPAPMMTIRLFSVCSAAVVAIVAASVHFGRSTAPGLAAGPGEGSRAVARTRVRSPFPVSSPSNRFQEEGVVPGNEAPVDAALDAEVAPASEDEASGRVRSIRQFREKLDSDRDGKAMAALALEFQCVAAMLDEQGRGDPIPEGDTVRAEPLYDGEVRFAAFGKIYSFDESEYPEFIEIRGLVQGTTSSGVVTADGLEGVSDELLTILDTRATEAIAALMRADRTEEDH